LLLDFLVDAPMIRILSGLVVLPIVLAGNAAIAATVRLAQADCSGYGSNIEIKACLRRSYEAADADLNRVYGQVKAGLGAEQRDLLTDTQLAWITYRDKGCEFETCKDLLTRSRIAKLEALSS
jgi:uncharacterized protein YecT (DUF1311 family)